MKALRELAFFRRKSASREAASTSASFPSHRPGGENATAASTSIATSSDATSSESAAPVHAAAENDSNAPAPFVSSGNALPADAAEVPVSNVQSANVQFVDGARESAFISHSASSNGSLGNGSSGGALPPLSGVRSLPRPALRWVGAANRIALRELDFAADADIVCSWQRETYQLNFADFRFNDSFAAAFRHDLRRAALDPNHALFVLDDGAPIGFLWLVICENTWTGERYGYINNLYLAPSQRAQGLGGELMQQSETWFKSRRIKRARLTVTVANEAACRLYQNRGYEITRWEMEKDL